jgi:hypothetical protein
VNGAAPVSDSAEVFRLIYRSRNRIPLDQRKPELGTLFSSARSSNKKAHITGALLTSGDWFAQVLEGDETVVRALFAKIEQDQRHDHVTVLDSRMVGQRVFSRWAMARVGAEREADIPLIAHVDGISPAARRATTPEQDSVLDVLREAARSDVPAR